MPVTKFDPEAMISSPRREAGTPNADGSLILYTVSSYDFSSHSKSSAIRILDTKTKESRLLDDSKQSSNPVWLDGNTVAILKADEEKGSTALVVGDVHDFKHSNYIAGTIDGPASDLKITALGGKRFGLAFSAPAYPDGSIHNFKTASKPLSSALVYRSLFVRHWNKYVYTYRQAIWYASLDGGEETQTKERYTMSKLVNALKATGLESPIPPDGGLDHFDISPHGLIFIAKDPKLDPASYTKCNIYLVPLSNFYEPARDMYQIAMGNIQGAMTSPTFSVDGTKVAFLAMQNNTYEADVNRIFVMPDTKKPGEVVEMLKSADEKEQWDRSPTSITWSHDGSSLYLTAQDSGRVSLFHLPVHLPDVSGLPKLLAVDNSVTSVKPLTDNKLFITSTSFLESSIYSFVTLQGQKIDSVDVLSTSDHCSKFGLSVSQIEEFWFPASSRGLIAKDEAHGWIMKPSNFSAAERYPVAFFIHGGPQGAWTNSWSTRWNPAVFAEFGYVVIMPNPIGSTGYGHAFVDGICEQWGGLAYQDIVNCFEYVEKSFDYVDIDRAVALGASYGGYMMNWMQGHELGRKFKALVCHNGIFSTTLSLATDELYFCEHDLGGWYSENKEKWRKWDPAQFTEHWKTPQLIIHSELDYRLSISDGLAAFNVLQRQGVESELLLFPDEDHFVQKPENSLKWHEAVVNWINKHIGLPLYKEDDLEAVVQQPQPKSSAKQMRQIEVVTVEN